MSQEFGIRILWNQKRYWLIGFEPVSQSEIHRIPILAEDFRYDFRLGPARHIPTWYTGAGSCCSCSLAMTELGMLGCRSSWESGLTICQDGIEKTSWSKSIGHGVFEKSGFSARAFFMHRRSSMMQQVFCKWQCIYIAVQSHIAHKGRPFTLQTSLLAMKQSPTLQQYLHPLSVSVSWPSPAPFRHLCVSPVLCRHCHTGPSVQVLRPTSKWQLDRWINGGFQKW